LLHHREDEQFVVAELGVGDVGDMPPMANMFQPDLAIVTMIGNEHYTSFRGPDGVAQEKGALLETVMPDGVAVLNGDDPFMPKLAKRTSARVVTFGRENADVNYRVSSISVGYPNLLSFTLAGPSQKLSLETQFPGSHFWMPVTAAVVAALELGVPIDIIQARVATFLPVNGRCSVLQTQNGPNFILDTAKAPSGTLGLAFDMVESASAPRKRIVLGIISDYAGSPTRQYRNAWQAAHSIADQVIFVGKNISSAKPSAQDVEDEKIVGFATAQEAYEYIKATSTPGELILLKGSSNLHLERIALAFNQQVLCWESSCKMRGDCFTCPGVSRVFNRKFLKRKEAFDRLAFRRLRKKSGYFI
jgi:UDP-N-acetylmuramoyl-tripeptide--D-alanyl-D-alanine ligase